MFLSSYAAVAGLLLAAPVAGINNGLGRTPQMGWNNFNVFGNDVTAATMITQAQSIKKSGLQALGYDYITMDDVWSNGRDKSGNLQPLASKFPNGVPAVAEQLHSMGFKWGMYSDAGAETCAGSVGSEGHEAQDAKTFASWGVDYLKYDNCHHDGKSARDRYSAMGDALKGAGRPIFFAMCNWGEEQVWSWGNGVGNSWRMSGDIKADWANIMGKLTQMQSISKYGGPGGWNDMDMLEVGNGKLSDDEQVAHFSLWAALKSPLMIGTDVTKASDNVLSILGNAAVIAISQDSLGAPATSKKNSNGGQGQLWSGPLYGGDYVVVLFNPGGGQAKITANAADIFDGDDKLAGQSWTIYDLWADRHSGAANKLGTRVSGTLTSKEALTATVATHGVAMFRLRSGQAGSGQLPQKRSRIMR